MNQATWRYISEDSSLNLHSCENLKSHKRDLHQEDAYISVTNGLHCLKPQAYPQTIASPKDSHCSWTWKQLCELCLRKWKTICQLQKTTL